MNQTYKHMMLEMHTLYSYVKPYVKDQTPTQRYNREGISDTSYNVYMLYIL